MVNGVVVVVIGACVVVVVVICFVVVVVVVVVVIVTGVVVVVVTAFVVVVVIGVVTGLVVGAAEEVVGAAEDVVWYDDVDIVGIVLLYAKVVDCVSQMTPAAAVKNVRFLLLCLMVQVLLNVLSWFLVGIVSK